MDKFRMSDYPELVEQFNQLSSEERSVYGHPAWRKYNYVNEHRHNYCDLNQKNKLVADKEFNEQFFIDFRESFKIRLDKIDADLNDIKQLLKEKNYEV